MRHRPIMFIAILVASFTGMAAILVLPLGMPHSAEAVPVLDVAVDSINSPAGTIPEGDVVVNATILNHGPNVLGSFEVNLTVLGTGTITLLNDSFETGSVPPPGWGDYSTGANLWMTTNIGPHSGIRCLWNQAQLNTQALVGSPGFNVSAGTTLTFWLRYADTGGTSYFDVVLSNKSQSMNDLMTSPTAYLGTMNTTVTGLMSTTWTQYSCNLSAWAGQKVWIGFQTRCLFGDNLYLDDVRAVSPNGTTYVFNDTVTVTGLSSGASSYVEFAPWHAANGTYTIQVSTHLVGDLNLANDMLSTVIVVQGSAILLPEYSWIGAPILACTFAILFSRRYRIRDND